MPKVRVQHGNLTIAVDTSRFEEQYEKAQEYLDQAVLNDSTPYVPYKNGVLRQSGIDATVPGRGEVVWNTPYAHYQYVGEKMDGPPPKQYTGEQLVYHTEGTGKEWFETAKKEHMETWVKNVREIAGGG